MTIYRVKLDGQIVERCLRNVALAKSAAKAKGPGAAVEALDESTGETWIVGTWYTVQGRLTWFRTKERRPMKRNQLVSDLRREADRAAELLQAVETIHRVFADNAWLAEALGKLEDAASALHAAATYFQRHDLDYPAVDGSGLDCPRCGGRFGVDWGRS